MTKSFASVLGGTKSALVKGRTSGSVLDYKLVWICFWSLVTSVRLSQIEIARVAATRRAERWNMCLYDMSSSAAGFCPSSLWQLVPACARSVFTPTSRNVSDTLPIPLEDLFGDVPPWPRLKRWNEDEVRDWLAKGAPGIDGWTKDLLRELPEESVLRLGELFNDADEGFLPTFWLEARCVGIPKPGSKDLRPLTVLSVHHRTWARRHASWGYMWLNAWAPPGLRGGRPRHSAADCSWDIALRVFASCSGADPPRHAIFVDTEKCFDRFLIDPIFRCAEHLGVPPHILRVARIYRGLRRILFVNGRPTQWLIAPHENVECCGLPQGCPFAPLFCNIAMAIWEKSLRVSGCQDLYSYLDDRTFFAPTLHLLGQYMRTTSQVDNLFGTSINRAKSARYSLGPQARRQNRIASISSTFPSDLNGIPTGDHTKAFTHLGGDVCVSGHVSKPKVASRKSAVLHRLQLVRQVPDKEQRCNLVSDKVAALYWESGTALNRTDLNSVTSRCAAGLRGKITAGRAQFRCRDLEFLFYPCGAHRTNPWCAMSLACFRQARRHLRSADARERWSRVWGRCANRVPGSRRLFGPFDMLNKVCTHFGWNWSDAFEVSLPSGPLSLSHESGRLSDEEAHILREAMRDQLWRSASVERSHLAGAPRGVDRDRVTHLLSKRCGPALVSDGVWTNGRALAAGLSLDGLCPRCHNDIETSMHLLWTCCSNSDNLLRLRSTFPQLADAPAGLSPCLAICGIPPVNCPLEKHCVEAIQEYLLLNLNERNSAAAVG